MRTASCGQEAVLLFSTNHGIFEFASIHSQGLICESPTFEGTNESQSSCFLAGFSIAIFCASLRLMWYWGMMRWQLVKIWSRGAKSIGTVLRSAPVCSWESDCGAWWSCFLWSLARHVFWRFAILPIAGVQTVSVLRHGEVMGCAAEARSCCWFCRAFLSVGGKRYVKIKGYRNAYYSRFHLVPLSFST